MAAAKGNRYGHRDATMALVAFRHGLRASELVDLWWPRWTSLHVRRVKQGSPSVHPILGDELRALRKLQRDQEPKSLFVFTSERANQNLRTTIRQNEMATSASSRSATQPAGAGRSASELAGIGAASRAREGRQVE